MMRVSDAVKCADMALEHVNALAKIRKQTASPAIRGAITRRINLQLDFALMWIDASFELRKA